MADIGSTPSLVVGIGVGAALSTALEPALEVPKQKAWADAPNRLPDIGLIAELVAGGKVSLADGRAMAKRLGFDQGPTDSLIWLAQNRLNFPAMLRLWRRFGAFDAGDRAALDKLVDETLAHETLDWDYQPWLKKMYDAELVGLGDIATAVVRGALPSPPYMPVSPPTTGLTVPRFPQVDIDPEVLAEALGYDATQLHLMIARSGLSLAPIFAANAFFRGLINDNDFLLAIAEGDLRTEWAETLKDAAREIPTARDGVQSRLRGWTDKAGMYEITRKHGMHDADADVLYQIERRPLNVHAITTGLARGGTFNPAPDEIQDPYVASSHQSDLGPEWYDLNEANKYLYPSAFVLRSLAQSGDLGGQPAVEQVLLEIGWKPSFAHQVSTAWTGGVAKGDPHVTKAANTLYTTTHKSYVGEMIDPTTATTALEASGVPAASVAGVLNLWNEERSLIRKQLTPAQVKKAWSTGALNPATGQPWTQQEALDALLARGYSHDDATTFLEL